jgi:hypothetical protein
LLLTLPAAHRAWAQFAGGSAVGFGGLNVGTQGPNSAQGETPGVRISESLLLHTALAVGAGVDSNVFFTDQNQISAAVTHIMPQFYLTNAGRGAAPDVLFNLVLNGDYRQYYGDKVNDDEKSAFGVGVGGTLDIGANSPWTFTILQNFIRDVQPSYLPGVRQFTRDVEQPGARIRWRPGGGRLDETLQYTFLLDHFEESDLSAADSVTHAIEFRSAFKFLPKTAVDLTIDQGFVHYINNSSMSKVDSKPFRVTAGLTGLVTTKLTARLAAGYGNGFYDVDPSPSSFIATAELGWIIGPFARAKIGYQHDFTNSLYGNYYDLDAAYAAWTQQFGSAVTAGLSVRYEHREYHCAPGSSMTLVSCFPEPGTADNRRDNWVALGAEVHYFPKPWFSAGASYQLTANVSDFELPDPNAPLPVRFVKHQVLGVVSATY